MESEAPPTKKAKKRAKTTQCDYIGEDGVRCPRIFKDKYGMHRHKYESRAHGLHEDEKFACAECKKTFHSADLLRHHKKNHSGTLPAPVAPENSPADTSEAGFDPPPSTNDSLLLPSISAALVAPENSPADTSEAGFDSPQGTGFDPDWFNEFDDPGQVEPRVRDYDGDNFRASNEDVDEVGARDDESETEVGARNDGDEVGARDDESEVGGRDDESETESETETGEHNKVIIIFHNKEYSLNYEIMITVLYLKALKSSFFKYLLK